MPAAPSATALLAERYANPATGDIAVVRKGSATVFQFGEWASEVASRVNQDGTLSFVTVAPGMIGLEFVVPQGGKKALVLRDAQHEYVFDEKRR